MRVICCQLDTVWENKPANYQRARELIERSAPQPHSLLLLPEMFASGFTMNIDAAADGPAAETEVFLQSLAREFKITILAGIVRRAPPPDRRGLNEAVAYGPDGTLHARYCKLHPFSFAGEDSHYASGSALTPFQLDGFMVSPLICYDLRFPETFRAAVKQGATLLCVLANWPKSRHAHWTTLLRARAIENQCYVAAVNRCGNDPKHSYAGGSTIIDMRGEIMAEAGDSAGAIHADIDADKLQAWRAEFPALNDIRADGL